MRKRITWRPLTRLHFRVRGHDSSAKSSVSLPTPSRIANDSDVLSLLEELKEDVAGGTSDPMSQSMIDETGNMIVHGGTLSQSPLTDSLLISARDRHRTPKPRPDKQLSPGRLKLQKNPYAQALATPVRNCFVTGIRLPEHFHLNTGLSRHPETGVPWHLPHGLARSSDNIEIKDSSDGGTASSTNTNEVLLTATSNPSPQPASLALSGAHVVAQKRCLALVSAMKAREYLGLLPKSWKEGFGLDAKRIVWREDMDTFVLELLRKKAVDQLTWLVGKSAGYVVRRYGGYEQIADSHQAAAALWLGHVRVTAKVSNAAEDANINGTSSPESDLELTGSMQPPPPYTMADYAGGCIPIYNMQTLLGEENLVHLRNSTRILGGEIAVIKHKNATVNVQMRLWQLMGYLAKSAD